MDEMLKHIKRVLKYELWHIVAVKDGSKSASMLTLKESKTMIAMLVGFSSLLNDNVIPIRLSSEYIQYFKDEFSKLEIPFKIGEKEWFPESNGYSIQKATIYIGKNKNSLNSLVNAKDDFKLGIALGYPETSVRAYINGIELHNDIYPPGTDLEAIYFSQFKKSKSNWREEIKTGKEWAKSVKKLAPNLYNEILNSSNFKETENKIIDLYN